MSVEIALLADHEDLLPDLAASYEREWPHWYGVHGDATTDLKERCRRSGLPIALIAIEDSRVIGTLALAERAISSHMDLFPCVIGFWVDASRRRRGIGGALLRAAADHARSTGFTSLYTCTNTAARLIEREGWVKIDIARTHGGEEVDLFALALR